MTEQELRSLWMKEVTPIFKQSDDPLGWMEPEDYPKYRDYQPIFKIVDNRDEWKSELTVGNIKYVEWLEGKLLKMQEILKNTVEE